MRFLMENWRKFLKEERLPNTNVVLYLMSSPIHGLGVFSGERLPKGIDLGVAQIRKGIGHDITPLGKYHNHSDEPNCINILSGNERHLVTSKDIEPNEEITINYNLQPDLEHPESNWI